VGLELVKHVESNKLASLVPGRTKSDKALLDEVKKLREEMAEHAKHKQEVEQGGGLLRKPRSKGSSDAGKQPKVQA
jgi:hypothetical protein